jgi:hypothetical protein
MLILQAMLNCQRGGLFAAKAAPTILLLPRHLLLTQRNVFQLMEKDSNSSRKESKRGWPRPL